MGVRSEEVLHHLEQYLQSRWGRRLELLELQEPLWKQAHELSVDALGFESRTSIRQRLDDEGLFGSSPIFLLDLSLLGQGSVISGVLELALSGFSFSCFGFLLF